jgi:hypothetical protein
MISVKETETTLELSNRISIGMRALIFFIGLIPLLAPYELLYKVRWENDTHLAFLFAFVIVLGALAVSGFFIFFALFAYSRRLYFDRRRQKVTFGFSHALQPYRERHCVFRDLSSIEVEVNAWRDGPDSYSLLPYSRDGSKFSIGYFDERTRTDRYKDLIKEWIGVG